MAQSTGFTCDLCHTFQVGTKAANGTFGPPFGWIIVKVRSEREVKEGEKAQTNMLDICSNLCLARLGAARWEAETGGSFAREVNKEYQRQWRQKRKAAKAS